ncbi:MAG: RIP metalloprotease RseP [Bdellovibrionales bacterium]|nr:RIP metalloprotease RseP [Oligoflexia bacterium]
MLSIIGFVLVLIPLVVVHELGHFLFAKLFNVRADAFSIGFGPVLFKKQIGETEFRVSAIPLGGYVKLLGEDPTAELSAADQKRALHHQAPWKRFFIFFGGPLFNFIWATIVFMAMMAIGEPQVSTVVGRVLNNSPAAQSGFVAGDKILSVDNEAVIKLEDLMMKLTDKPAQEVNMGVDRSGQVLNLKVKTGTEEGFSQYGEKKPVGTVEGLIPNARMTKVGISDPDSPAAKAGLKTGDEIVSVNGKKVETFEQLEGFYSTLKTDTVAREPVKFEVKAGTQNRFVTLAPHYSGDLGRDFGLFSSELFVEQAVADAPAAKAGIQKGDQVVAISGTPVHSFFELRQTIQKAGETQGKLTASIARAGKTVTYEIVPQVSTERDPMLKKMKQYTIGIMPVPSMMEPAMVTEQTWNPITLLYKGTAKMFDLSARNLISIGKMVQGQVSVKSLGGPILIGKLAGDSLSRGIIDFLRMMGILSIGLGVLNILPIPVLDGGHIVMLGIEAVRGKALSLKQIEMAQKVGLVLILLIMGVVMKNDISRLPIFN